MKIMRPPSPKLREVFSPKSFRLPARRWVPALLAVLLGAMSLNPALAGGLTLTPINPGGANVPEPSVFNGAKEPTIAQQVNVYHYAYKPFNGSAPVGTQDLVMTDLPHKRLVPMKVYFPQQASDSGTYPIIIFSHGFGASKDFYGYLGKYYASHGYISIHPDHVGSNTTAYLKIGAQVLTGQSTPEEIAKNVFENETVARIDDVEFTMNQLGAIEAQIPQLKGRMNKNAIGLAGHSYGAITTDLMSGMEGIAPSGKAINRGNSRIKAFASISGCSLIQQTPNAFFPNVRTFSRIQAPVMRIQGTQEQATEELSNQYLINHLAAFNLFPLSGNKYEIQVQDSDHQDFAAVSTKPGGLFNAITLTKNSSLAFFDKYLKNDPKADLYIKTRLPLMIKAAKSQYYTR